MQNDRPSGAMGGEGPIYYVALSRYARDFGITGVDLQRFYVFMNALDAEYLAIRRADTLSPAGTSQEQ